MYSRFGNVEPRSEQKKRSKVVAPAVGVLDEAEVALLVVAERELVGVAALLQPAVDLPVVELDPARLPAVPRVRVPAALVLGREAVRRLRLALGVEVASRRPGGRPRSASSRGSGRTTGSPSSARRRCRSACCAAPAACTRRWRFAASATSVSADSVPARPARPGRVGGALQELAPAQCLVVHGARLPRPCGRARYFVVAVALALSPACGDDSDDRTSPRSSATLPRASRRTPARAT